MATRRPLTMTMVCPNTVIELIGPNGMSCTYISGDVQVPQGVSLQNHTIELLMLQPMHPILRARGRQVRDISHEGFA